MPVRKKMMHVAQLHQMHSLVHPCLRLCQEGGGSGDRRTRAWSRASDGTPAAGADARAAPFAQEGAAPAEDDFDAEDVELLAVVAAAARTIEPLTAEEAAANRSIKPLTVEEASPQPAAGRARARNEVRAPANSGLKGLLWV